MNDMFGLRDEAHDGAYEPIDWCDRTNSRAMEAAMSVYAAEDELLNVLDVLALSTDPMFAINQRHRIVFWNKPLRRLLGYDYDEVVGKSCGNVLAGLDTFGNRYCSEACPIVSLTQRGECARQFRLRSKTKSGDAVALDISVVKFTLRNGGTLLLHVVRPAEEVAIASAPRAEVNDERLRRLTTREMEVLSMLASGTKTRGIAERLGIAPLTARNHIRNVIEKLEVHSMTEAVALAYQMRMV